MRDGSLASEQMELRERALGPLLLAHAPATFTPRAYACAAAYGGPAAFETLVNAWYAAQGSNLYVPFHVAPPGFPLPSGLPWR